MKYIIFAFVLFVGYQYYDANAVVSSGIPIIDRIQTESVTRQETIDAVLPILYETCTKLPNKQFIEDCQYSLNYQKPFCIKMFNLDSPEKFTSKSILMDKIALLTNCMVDKNIF